MENRQEQQQAHDFVFPKEVAETMEKFFEQDESDYDAIGELLLAVVKLGAYGEKPNVADLDYPLNMLYFCMANWVQERKRTSIISNATLETERR